MAAKNVRTRRCRQAYGALPAAVRKLAELAFRQFCENPDHPSLQRKQLADGGNPAQRAGSYSVRISLSYRAVYFVDGDTNVWYFIGSHADYDRLIGG